MSARPLLPRPLLLDKFSPAYVVSIHLMSGQAWAMWLLFFIAAVGGAPRIGKGNTECLKLFLVVSSPKSLCDESKKRLKLLGFIILPIRDLLFDAALLSIQFFTYRE